MDNKEIIEILRHTVALMELHGENEYKIKSYGNAIFNLERFEKELSSLSRKELEEIKGVGKTIASDLDQLIREGHFETHDKLTAKTPEGLFELINTKGIGIKKIRTLWNELSIESLEDLTRAISENKLAGLKGFGGKTQENILKAINYRKTTKGRVLYAEAEEISKQIIETIKAEFPDTQINETGPLRRKVEIIDTLSYLVLSADADKVKDFIRNCEDWKFRHSGSGPFILRAMYSEPEIKLEFVFSNETDHIPDLVFLTGSPRHLTSLTPGKKRVRDMLDSQSWSSEEELYQSLDLEWIPPELREGMIEYTILEQGKLNDLVKIQDIKGIIHCHTTYSDGLHTVREMAGHAITAGYEYLGISDHSKSAYYYANGLYEERVLKQMDEIDELNKELSPFRIFKGIESDILVDGSLDYGNEILEKFDFIIASIHGSLKMDRSKATQRLIKAIENPFTTMLGHLTGRQLLDRDGYPVDHQKVIDACARNNVIIELNAHPKRLDLDWRWIHKALDRDVMLSINPDAHRREGMEDVQYGVWAGRKGGLTREMTLNCQPVNKVAEHFSRKKEGVSL